MVHFITSGFWLADTIYWSPVLPFCILWADSFVIFQVVLLKFALLDPSLFPFPPLCSCFSHIWNPPPPVTYFHFWCIRLIFYFCLLVMLFLLLHLLTFRHITFRLISISERFLHVSCPSYSHTRFSYLRAGVPTLFCTCDLFPSGFPRCWHFVYYRFLSQIIENYMNAALEIPFPWLIHVKYLPDIGFFLRLSFLRQNWFFHSQKTVPGLLSVPLSHSRYIFFSAQCYFYLDHVK